MKKRLLIGLTTVSVMALLASGGLFLGLYKPEPVRKPTLTSTSAPVEEPVIDPSTHDTFDVEFAKKLILYHQLAVQLDNYAKTSATNPEIIAYATQKSTYNTEQANAYTNILNSWGEKYTNLEDFPKTAGSACAGYPVFPGMLPHADVSAYLQSSSQEVDKEYLTLMTKHHKGITLLTKAEGHFINFGELMKLRDTFYANQDREMLQMEQLQQKLGYI